MSNVNLPFEVNRVLTNWVSQNRDFTAYDVTQEVRTNVGPNVNVDHQDVNGLVRASFLQGLLPNYERELDYSLGVSPAPYRYQPNTPIAKATGNAYNWGGVNTNPRVTPSNNPIVTALNGGTSAPVRQSKPSSPQANQASNQSSVLSVSNGTLRVLKEAVGKAGFRSGQTVHATYVPSARKIFLTTNPVRGTNDPNAVTAAYRVDTKSNLRVSLSRLGAEKNKSFIAVPQSGQIEISCG